MQQKLDWNTSTEEAEEVLQGIYNDSEDPEITVAQLRGKIKGGEKERLHHQVDVIWDTTKVYLQSSITHSKMMITKN